MFNIFYTLPHNSVGLSVFEYPHVRIILTFDVGLNINSCGKLKHEPDGTELTPQDSTVLLSFQLRYRKDKLQSKQKPIFPVVNEVKDLSTGCAVAAVIHHYCPGLLRLEGTSKPYNCEP